MATLFTVIHIGAAVTHFPEHILPPEQPVAWPWRSGQPREHQPTARTDKNAEASARFEPRAFDARLIRGAEPRPRLVFTCCEVVVTCPALIGAPAGE